MQQDIFSIKNECENQVTETNHLITTPNITILNHIDIEEYMVQVEKIMLENIKNILEKRNDVCSYIQGVILNIYFLNPIAT